MSHNPMMLDFTTKLLFQVLRLVRLLSNSALCSCECPGMHWYRYAICLREYQ